MIELLHLHQDTALAAPRVAVLRLVPKDSVVAAQRLLVLPQLLQKGGLVEPGAVVGAVHGDRAVQAGHGLGELVELGLHHSDPHPQLSVIGLQLGGVEV
jgi:hypothetical protein